MKIIYCKNLLQSEYLVTTSCITTWEAPKLLSSLIFNRLIKRWLFISRLIKRWLKKGRNFPDVLVLLETSYTSIADSRKIEHDCRNHRWTLIYFSVNSDYSGEMHVHSFALKKNMYDPFQVSLQFHPMETSASPKAFMLML